VQSPQVRRLRETGCRRAPSRERISSQREITPY
jgi:hypothetical protein